MEKKGELTRFENPVSRSNISRVVRASPSGALFLDYQQLSGQNINLDFQVLYIGAMGTEKPPTSLTSASSNKEIPNFVGHMQHFIFNGQHFFDMARSGQMTNFKVTAKFGKKDEIVHHPVTFKSKFTFIGLSQLKAYSSMNLYFQFKTLEPNGLILFNGGKGQDFIAIELVDGHLHYIFNLGDGPRKLKSNTETNGNELRNIESWSGYEVNISAGTLLSKPPYHVLVRTKPQHASGLLYEKSSETWLACYEFEPSASKNPSCWGCRRTLNLSRLNVLLLVLCGRK
ncbi:neurexin-2 [Trichonephila clavipes]|nr:neurexin-2 [Trichonephila clavipes]